jgi:cellulose synthase/poly-beta-1,6-N-acetylglucosamine synthase-like glycosyltransferase
MNSIFIASGPFSVFRRSVFEKIGLFDEKNISEDMEIALRAQKNNFKIKFCPEVIIKTVPPDNFKSLLKQRVRWILGFIDNYAKYRDIENIYLREIVFGISIILYILLPLSFLIILYMYGKQLYNFLKYLSSINYDIYYVIENSFSFDINTYIFQLLSTSQLILIIFSIILLVNFLLFISVYKRYDKSKSWLLIIYYSVIYLSFSIYFNAIFIIVAIYYKLFGRNLRWGGIVWNNSLINKLLNKKYG